jgi:Holliday junction resolvase RusA-like endonuclease
VTETTPVISFEVRGQPRTEGSLRPIHRHTYVRGGNCRCSVNVIHQQDAHLKEWRDLVAKAAAKAMRGRMPLEGPLAVCFGFRFPRPRLQTAAERASPFVYLPRKWDLEKLVRAANDALTAAAVWHDDSQVAAVAAEKRWADGVPVGCRITVACIALPVKQGALAEVRA